MTRRISPQQLTPVNPPRGRGELEIRGYRNEALGLRVGPGAFFQANRPLWPHFRDAVVAACGSGKLAVELYAGGGFFTAGLERSFEQRGLEGGTARHKVAAALERAGAELDEETRALEKEERAAAASR